jgi:phosphoheptose isomerase
MPTVESLFLNDPGLNNKIPFIDHKFDSGKYLSNLSSAISAIDTNLTCVVAEKIRLVALQGRTVFFAGNGGSHAIASHMVCDYSKGLMRLYSEPLRCHCLGSNPSLFSALSNDFGFDNAFSAELEIYSNPDDCLFLISSSGNSKNILKLAEFAKSRNILTIGLDGFGGGKLSKVTDYAFTVDCQTYPAVEAVHQVILDCISLQLWK